MIFFIVLALICIFASGYLIGQYMAWRNDPLDGLPPLPDGWKAPLDARRDG